MGGGGPRKLDEMETRLPGQRAARGSRRHRGEGSPSAPACTSVQAPPARGEASLVELPFAPPDAPINSRLPCGGGTSARQRRVRERRGAAAPPRCPRVCKLGGGRRSRGLPAEAGPGRKRGRPWGRRTWTPQHRHATCTALCTPAFPAASPPVRLTLARFSCTSQPLGEFEEGRLPVAGGFVGRIEVCQVLLEEKRVCCGAAVRSRCEAARGGGKKRQSWQGLLRTSPQV